MHSAPSVEYPVGRSAFALWLEAGLLVLWALGLLLWAAALGRSLTGLPGAWWFSLCAGMALAGVGYWQRRREPQATLAWVQAAEGSSGQWTWLDACDARPNVLASLRWSFDAQFAVLLRLCDASGQVRWVWLDRLSQPRRWGDLRRALVWHREQMSKFAAAR